MVNLQMAPLIAAANKYKCQLVCNIDLEPLENGPLGSSDEGDEGKDELKGNTY